MRDEEDISAPPDAAGRETARALEAMRTPLARVRGIGSGLAGRLSQRGLNTVEDVLYFVPVRYEDRREVKKIRELSPGSAETVVAEVLAAGEARYGRRRVFEAAFSDGGPILRAKWFNFRPAYMKGRFKQGRKMLLHGMVSTYGGRLEMVHPDVEVFDEEAVPSGSGRVDAIVPVYSQVGNLHQKTVRRLVGSIVATYARLAPPGAPAGVMERCGFMDIKTAFMEAHAPERGEGELARRSLAFDELFIFELGLALKRRGVKRESGIAFGASGGGGLVERLRSALPFLLTRAQERVLGEIEGDMASPHPMNRLLQGDVGSGKTVVSLMAALRAVDSGYQAAIMAPTEILAEQHFLTTRAWTEGLGVRTALLTGRSKGSAREKALACIRAGEADIIIGTHALIQKDVEFGRLGFVVIDEQHRFGVAQRAALRHKCRDAAGGASPDMLIMTATPIPRTLGMTVFGDLDVSVIDELPPGREPVRTLIIRERDRTRAYATIRRELDAGGQCYIVYPLVEESEELSLRDATNMKAHLERDVFADYRVGLLHGRMKPAEKEAVMEEFKAGATEVLVSTTVIEVGVDVPNATVMLIEHAERFGLAQLHQLRGRVGRGARPSICLLLARWTQSEDTYRRLKVMEETCDGFRIAEEDLRIRGPGDLLGTRQAGLPEFRTSLALTDMELLRTAREEAFAFLEADQDLESPEGRRIAGVLEARWRERLDLAGTG